MSWFNKESNSIWKNLTSDNSVQELVYLSFELPVLIFKHSTRCSISSMMLSRFEREWEQPEFKVELFYLDLIQFRNLSNEIAEKLNIEHQSPQLIVLSKGEILYSASHNAIDTTEILKKL